MRLELKIVELLARIEKKFTINEIAKNLKEHYSFVHRTINKMTKEEVILKEKTGKSFLCSLNFNNEKTLILLELSESERRDEFYKNNKELRIILQDFVESLKSNKEILSVVLFGSYAKGSATKESDIDILIICKSEVKIEKIAREIYAKYGKETNAIILTKHKFKEERHKPLIREIIINHYVLYRIGDFVRGVYKR